VLASAVFLKSLSLQGFKSFADKTTLEFTPGVSVIVGPNGSGKSNLSDAIAWVLGEQGPKTLRGGKMEDVIFAGTPKRNGAGRAEVSLTIDNSAGLLPIEFTEVTITRTIFRGGDSEYAINATPCRLLDVQELLSDSGIGRELHTIVGQGQLDGVLQARPEERRAYIEEAAGILKYRRRKERAVRKLDRTDTDIERLGDVIGELRRQIRPLEQQAETAKRSAQIQADLAAVTLRLWVHEYAIVAEEGDREAEARLNAEAEQLAARLRELSAAVERLETESAASSSAAESALSTEYRLSSARERVAGLARLADERARHLDELAVRAPEGQAPPPELIAETEAELESIRAERERAEQHAREAEQEWRALTAAQEAAAKAREEIVHLQGERAALRAAVHAAEEERRRLAERRAFLARRRQAREDEIKTTADELRILDDREGQLEAALDEARAALGEAQAAANESAQRLRDLERRADALDARRAVLAEEAARGTPANLIGTIPGLVAVLRETVRPAAGWERAAQAALEPVAGAIVAARPEDALQAIRTLKSSGGRGVFVADGAVATIPAGIRTAEDAIQQSPDAVRALLRGIALAEDLDAAWRIAAEHPGITVVTRDGDRIAGGVLSGGDPEGLGRDVGAELAAVDAGIRENAQRLASARMESERAAGDAGDAGQRVAELMRQGNEVDAELTGVADHLAELEREDHAAQREDAMMAGRVQEMEERLVGDTEKLSAVESRLARAVAEERPVIDAGQMAAVERRAAERSLHLGGLAERERTVARRVEELKSRALRVAQERQEWERSREARIAASRKAAAIAAAAVVTRDRLEIWIEEARRARFAVEERRTRCAAELAEARRERRETETSAEEVREMAHRSDLARAERSHRLASMIERLRSEHDLSPEEAMARAEVSADDDVDDLRRRANVLERKLAMVGRVNPIAMEQYQGLVDRHAFLTEQVTDLKKSRKDLLAVVDEVDTKIVEMFAAAFDDVRREFEDVFVRLFPGGEGKLTLTDPGNMLDTGVDIEARPGGKRVKRISLLSGGERSLVAIALLSSIFRARPSPFYLLDEVEAALDDVNLHRFLELVREFKDASQILIVTHQKRTMEVGDILYGISMGNDGVTRVLAQKFDEPATL